MGEGLRENTKMIKFRGVKEGVEFMVGLPHTYQGSATKNFGFGSTLTPKETFQLINDIIHALYEWHELTGRKIDEDNPH